MGSELKRPKASPAQVDYHMRQLGKLFARASDEQFLQLMWAIDALRAGKSQIAANYVDFPPAATDQTMGSSFRIHEWETETLLIQLLLGAGGEPKEGTPTFDCRKFADVAQLVSRLRKLEDVESGMYLSGNEFKVLDEVNRAAHRQFHWQRGYLNAPQFYRYAYLYAQGKCGEYFQEQFGIPITEFNFVGFALCGIFQSVPWRSRSTTVPELGLTEDLVKRALPLLLLSVDKARKQTRDIVKQVNEKHGKPIPTAYLPSILRRFPLLSLKEDSDNLIAPIPQALLIRVTSGLYYDIIPGGQKLLNEASDRFEGYVAAYISALMERFEVRRAYRYEPQKGSPIDTPDVLVADGDRIALAIECKATKLNYLAQFAEEPFEAEKKQYLQLANGALQLWRFFSHVRRGLLTEKVDADTAAMVITLDSFYTINFLLKEKIISEANALADKEEDIIADDRRTIIFCPIEQLEPIVSRTNEDSFFALLKTSCERKNAGWELTNVYQKESEGKPNIARKFPFTLDDLLPWWERTREVYEKYAASKHLPFGGRSDGGA